MDIFVSNYGSRYGYELVADATRDELLAHYNDQAVVYKAALKLSKVFVVNFISELPDVRPDWWYIADDPLVSAVHIYIPRPENGNEIFVFHSKDKKEINSISADIVQSQSTVLDLLMTQVSLAPTPNSENCAASNAIETVWMTLQDEKYFYVYENDRSCFEAFADKKGLRSADHLKYLEDSSLRLPGKKYFELLGVGNQTAYNQLTSCFRIELPATINIRSEKIRRQLLIL